MDGANEACSLCGASSAAFERTIDSYTMYRCQTCDFLYIAPAPSDQEIRDFYQQESYFADSNLGYAQDYLAQAPQHRSLAQRRLKQIEQQIPHKGTVLDLGCAVGFFLDEAQKHGWQSLGIEISATMRTYAQTQFGLHIVEQAEALSLQANSLDCISMWEYIEHLPQPNQAIAQAANWLRPGGMLAISTPNTGYWLAQHQPEQWREFKPPAHLGFFTEKTLRHILEQNGFRVKIIRTTACAPRQPYALQRLLSAYQKLVGSGVDRRTPLWFTFSILWRLAEKASQLAYRLRWPDADLHIGLEAYAIKQ
jgi:2-polyprenyl-3-methyl-5-hydroxy-6-metoxy-1,4-benzoquinol methylase